MEIKKSEKSEISKVIDNSIDSVSSEHCCTIEKAKRIFENFNPINNTQSNNSSEHCCTVEKGKQIFNSVSNVESNISKSRPSYKNISSFDIFSGTVDDHDIPPIEADIEEDGVYPCADISLIENKLAYSTNNGQITKRKKSSIMKANSYTNRKNNPKKLSVGRSFVQESDVDKENEGVLIRMRNQESYYDGKDKYQSQLPEVPLYLVYGNSQLRRSLFAQKGYEKSIDINDGDINNDPFQNSIIFPDISLPPVDNNYKNNEKIARDDDNESMELEPTIDNDSFPDNKIFQLFSANSQRLRWAETEEGKKLIEMQKLGEDVIKWQEAQFEVITSEASYYRSLEVLVNKIYKSPYMDCAKEKKDLTEHPTSDVDDAVSSVNKPVISATQKHHLFSNILEIHIVSGELLKALESRWRENPFIKDISDILVDFCKEKLKPYVTYLRNQRFQTDTYNKLLNLPEFVNIIRKFENDSDCVMMNLCSFLMLPMQRVLRLKLLMTVVKHHIPNGYPTNGCDTAIEALEKLIKECSDEKMVMEQKEEILLICNRLIIKDKMNVSIGSKPLLKNGQLKVTSSNSNASKLLSNSLIRRNNNRAQLYLFEDQLIIAKQKNNDDREVVVDICKRSDIEFVEMTSPKLVNKSNFKLVLSNGIKGCAEYICSAESPEDLNDWKNVFTIDNSRRDEFDFCEAFVIENFIPTSKREMELKRGQILSVIKVIDKGRAIASSGGKQGEILLDYVQYVSTPQPNKMFSVKLDCQSANRVE